MLKLKKSLSLLLVMLMSIALLAGCGKKQETPAPAENTQQQTEVKKKKIGVCVADFSDQFQVYVMDGMKETEEKIKDKAEVIYMDAKYDPQKQISQVENLIAQKVDSIVLFAVDGDSGNKMAEAIKAAGIHLILVNRPIPNMDLALTYVGSNSVESGEIQAREMARLLNGKGNIAVLLGEFGHQPQIERLQGYKNILKDYPDMKIVVEDSAGWYRDKGMALMENWLQKKTQIDAVLANNDEMALGAIKAIEDAGMAGKIVVSGIDATPEALEFVKAGRQAYTVFQDAKGQGRKSVEVAFNAAEGQTIDKEYMIPYELVTKDKVDEYAARYK
jgi:inositol transport system substrate-binding protein